MAKINLLESGPRKTRMLTKIVGKFQVTVPPEIRNIFKIREGDLLEWRFEQNERKLIVVPMRAELLTPALEDVVGKAKVRRKTERESAKQEVPA